MNSPVFEPVPQSSGHRWLGWRSVSLACLAILAMGVLWARLRPGATPNHADPVAVFVAGQRLVYQVQFTGSSHSDFGALFGEGASALSHVFEVSLEGELAVTVLEAGPERTSLVYQLRPENVQFHGDGQEAPEQAQMIRAELARPVFGMLDARGRMLSVRFDPASGPLAQHMARTLLAATQFVGPAPGADPRNDWEAEEDDPSGTLLAHYEVRADGSVRKTKVRYLQPSASKTRKTVVLSPSIRSEGECLATFEDGALAALSVAEMQFLTLHGKLIGQGDLKLEMHLVRSEEATPAELASLRADEAERATRAPAVALSVRKSSQESRLAIQRKELGNATLASLLSDLKEAAAGSVEDKDLTRLFLKFKALAIVQPETCVRLGELLTSVDADGLTMRILIEALEAAGHDQAQAALCAAIQGRPGDWPARSRLIPALGTAESPALQTEQVLQALAFGNQDNNTATAARLALGNLARTLGDVAPTRASKIVERLLGELAASTSVDGAWQLLLALGNAGAVQSLPTLTRYLDNPAAELRGAAAWALRWIDAPQVDRLLTTKVLGTDNAPAVRLEAVRALRFREHTANCQAQEQALATETDVAVRLALFANLWDARASYPRAQRLVELAAAADRAPEVRTAAATMLRQARVEP